jgi:6-pyruvoyltetrahydropterin/6-carboxytetrahydropterin synthase
LRIEDELRSEVRYAGNGAFAIASACSAGRCHGRIIDFGDVKQLFGPVFEQLDHHPLHEVSDLEDNDAATPVRWIRRQTAGILLQLDRIDLYETRGCGTILTWGEAGPALPV